MESASAAAAPPRGTIDIAVIDGVPEAIASQIVDVALAHPPTSGVHAGQPYEVTEVSAVAGETFGGSGDHARVVIEFAEPLPPEVWPNEAVCAIGRRSNDITGIAWLVSLDSEEVIAYSPQWDYAIDCVAGSH